MGPAHPSVGHTLSNLGLLAHERGDLAQARLYHERSVAVLEAALGPNHLDMAIAINNLANVVAEQGELDEADAMFGRVLELQLAHLRPDDRRIAETYTNHGVAFYEQGASERALEPLKEALEIFEADLAQNKPDVAQVLVSLAEVHAVLDQHAEAVPLLQRALKVYAELTDDERGAVPPGFEDHAREVLAAARSELTEPAAPRPLAPHPPGSGAPPADR